VRIRRATSNDIDAMIELQRESSLNWSQEHFESLFRTTAPDSSRYFVLVAEDSSGSIVAYLAAHRVDSDWELQYIVVAKESRRGGIAKRLLGELVEHVRSTRGREIFLEVRESNHNARSLYRKTGFEETGLRRGYYSNPPEDAILCSLRLY
jgi:ribosomal-protein-alanine acetyltransferase